MRERRIVNQGSSCRWKKFTASQITVKVIAATKLSQNLSKTAYRPDVDGLRAVAILPVVGFHAFPGRFPGGFVGVDVFFVISGFLITGIIVRELSVGTFSLAAFYARRIRRIFPALCIVLFATCLIGWLVLLPDEYDQLARHILAGALFLSNFALWQEVGYFDTAADLKPLLHLWSLGVEEQFYVLWPITMALAWRAGKHAFLGIVIVGIASFILNLVFIGGHPTMTFYLPFTRFWELMLGAGIAVAAFRGQSLPQSARHFASVLGLTLILGCIPLLSNDQPFPGWPALIPTVGAGLMIAAGPSAWANRYILSTRAAVFVGLISYPLYLWHWPLFSIARILQPWGVEGPGQQRATMLGLIVLSFALGYGTFRLLELKVRMAPSPRYVGSLASALCSVCVLAFLGTAPFARLNSVPGDPLAWEPSRWSTQECLLRWGLTSSVEPFCVESNSHKQPSVLVLGDSHSNHWMPGLMKSYPELAVLQIGSGGCPPLEGVHSFAIMHDEAYRKLCHETMARAFQILRESKTISTVILAARLTDQIPGDGSPPGRLLKSDIESEAGSNSDILDRALERSLRAILALNKKLVFILQVPELGFHPKRCVRLRTIDAFRSVQEPCAVSRDEFQRRQKAYRDIVLAATSRVGGVTVVDPAIILCDDFLCHGLSDRHLLYRDADHMSVFGSEYVIERLKLKL
jgi:peptidoglycan/LPS O-acetylase OafA/YrhL